MKGSPAKDNAETIEIPNGREAVHDSERASASPAHEAEADEKEEDYDAVPDPAVMLTELEDEEEEEDDEMAGDEAVPEEKEDISPRVEPRDSRRRARLSRDRNAERPPYARSPEGRRSSQRSVEIR